MTRRTLLFAWITLLGSAPLAPAQGTRSDYERAGSLRQRFEGKVFKTRVTPHWDADGSGFWYRNDLADGKREFIRVDAVHGVRVPAFDHPKLAEALSRATGKDAPPDRLPIDNLVFDGTSTVRFNAAGKRWECKLPGCELRETGKEETAAHPLAGQDVPRRSTRTGEETSITFTNRTGETVEIFWIDPSGERHSYGKLAAGDGRELHTYAGHVWVVVGSGGKSLGVFEADRRGGEAVIDGSRKAADVVAPLRRRRRTGPTSPDGKWTAFVKDHNLFLRDQDGEFALTSDGKADDGYPGDFFWSPDSRHLVALRRKDFEERKVYLIESSPRDQLQPKLQSYGYRKPGDPIPLYKPHLFDVEKRREVPVGDELFPNPWAVTEVRWDSDGTRFTFLYNQRGHQVLRVVGVDADSGGSVGLVEERSKTFVDYAGKHFSHYVDDTGELIWMSERDGWNHLYLINLKAGAVKNPITQGPWVVRGVDRVDPAKRQVWFRAGGIRPGQDPYFIHYCRINFDGTGLIVLTEGDGTHTVEHSPDGRFLLDTYSRVDLPPVTELRRSDDGGLACALERADDSALEAAGWKVPEPFVAKGRDGSTDIYGVIFRPTNFDPDHKYPVIEQIYAGPQGSFVPKAFRPFYPQQALAELGFVVVQIDGMGTSNRSKAFHDVCWKNLGDAGFADRILWMKAAAAKYPQLDLTRVGVYGGSAGGQNALGALLTHGDFYRVAAADCGCHDNRMDKIWWNELWMGWPIGREYAEQSNVTNAPKLQGKLLLTVGELDRNVDPASTMQVVNALIKANKDFELIVFPGAGHGAGGSPYGLRRRNDFFVRHLLGVEPRSRP